MFRNEDGRLVLARKTMCPVTHLLDSSLRRAQPRRKVRCMFHSLRPHLRSAARLAASWRVPLALAAAAVCLVAGVSLPILVLREFVVFARRLSILDGANALLGQCDWPLAAIILLF